MNITIFRQKRVDVEVGDSIVTRWDDTPREIIKIDTQYGMVCMSVNRPEPRYGSSVAQYYPHNIKKVIKKSRKELLQ
jgi:hypothetical protein